MLSWSALHMQGWDEHAIAMLDRCPSAKCFLSHYPPATGDPGLQVPVLCMSHFDEGAQMPSFEARNFDLQVRQPALCLLPTTEVSQDIRAAGGSR